jgi:hypothetical protein
MLSAVSSTLDSYMERADAMRIFLTPLVTRVFTR